jgi:CMP-N-acetylneuraminic acid synthetase
MGNKKNNIFAMIPARYGSTRLKLKNLALIDGRPMISYAINAAKNSNVFEKIFLNSEHTIFSDIANRYEVDFYKRKRELGGSSIKADNVVYDFIINHPEADIVAWINPTSPLQTDKEISDICKYFVKNDLDSLITVEDKRVHSMFDSMPVNYNIDDIFSQTQDLMPVQNFVYSVMMWRSEIFRVEFERNGHAFFCGKFKTYPVSKKTGLIVKNKEDLMIIDLIMRSLNDKDGYIVQYDDLAKRG